MEYEKDIKTLSREVTQVPLGHFFETHGHFFKPHEYSFTKETLFKYQIHFYETHGHFFAKIHEYFSKITNFIS